jgi:nitric oxide dioxygenase
VYFIHAARNRRYHAFANEVRRISVECPSIRTHFLYDSPPPEDVRHSRCDSTGFVDQELLSKLLPTIDSEVFLCSPKPFMLGVLECLNSLGVTGSSIHYELFCPKQEMILAKSGSQTGKRLLRAGV